MAEQYLVNDRIRSKELRVIDDVGGNLGVITTQEALRIARSKELDLLVVAPNAQPPVAKILNFSKFLYEERKKKSSSRSKKSELKEFRFGPSTGEGDIQRFIDRSIEFLKDGNRVKMTIKLRGREMMFPDIAFEKLRKIETALEEVSKVETPAKMQGNMIWVVFVSK